MGEIIVPLGFNPAPLPQMAVPTFVADHIDTFETTHEIRARLLAVLLDLFCCRSATALALKPGGSIRCQDPHQRHPKKNKL
jgi:hypothetical protein